METIWQLTNKNGKPISLRIGDKIQKYEVNNLNPGAYALIMHTTDKIPGGIRGPRYITCDVSIRTKDDNEILRDVYKIHSKEPTAIVEFFIREHHSPAKLIMVFETHAPFVMRMVAKLLKNYNPEFISLDIEKTHEYHKFIEYGFKTLCITDILDSIKMDSIFRTEAYEEGLIRPFLFLSSMHPATRQQIGDILGISLIDMDSYGNSHSESMLLLKKKRKGIQWRTESTYETIFKHSTNWYHTLYRSFIKIYDNSSNLTKLNNEESLKVCKSSKNLFMSDMELEFLERIAYKHHEQVENNKYLILSADKLLTSPKILELFHIMEINGIKMTENLKRFLIELCLQIWFDQEEEEKQHNKIREKVIISDDKELPFRERKIIPEQSYDLSDVQFLEGIKFQLLKGHYDPQKGYTGIINKISKMGVRWGFKTLILVPFMPILVWPFIGYIIVDKLYGSSHDVNFVAVVQILLQRLLLAANGININRFY